MKFSDHLRGRFARATLFATLAVASVVLASTDEAKREPQTQTPIKHLVVIFQENVSFDHYFATYPNALNPQGEPRFEARPDTPSVNGLNESLLAPNNPNSVQPFRLDRSQFETADQDHAYGDEQRAFNFGLMDQFVEKVGRGAGPNGEPGGQGMGYYDGNTVTALWNYAQHFAMSDNSFSTTFGPSSPGALNLISGNTSGATLLPLRPNGNPASPNGNIYDGLTTGAIVGDPRPGFDDCVVTNPKLQGTNMITVAGKNVGDLLNAKGITWGWFQ